MKYLIIDKRQRVQVDTMGEIPTGSARIVEELEKRNIEYNFIYNDQLEFLFEDGKTLIKADKKDILEYTHIIFRGHSLDDEKEYHFKRYIIDHIDEYNEKNPSNKILVQNAQAIKNFPYYNKIAMAMFCNKHNIPFFNTYYKSDGDYKAQRDMLKEYPLIIKEYSGKNRLEMIDGKEKVKKNVFKLDNQEDLGQDKLANQNMTDFFLQEFSDAGEDIRIFVKLGKVVAGWRRKASEGIMTVLRGEYEMYNEPSEEIKGIAERVASLLEADFMAVDFMYIHNKPHVQEISFHPGYKAYENKIEGEPVNIAEAIISAFKSQPS